MNKSNIWNDPPSSIKTPSREGLVGCRPVSTLFSASGLMLQAPLGNVCKNVGSAPDRPEVPLSQPGPCSCCRRGANVLALPGRLRPQWLTTPCSVLGHRVGAGGPAAAPGPGRAVRAGGRSAQARAAFPREHRRQAEVRERRLHLQVSGVCRRGGRALSPVAGQSSRS